MRASSSPSVNHRPRAPGSERSEARSSTPGSANILRRSSLSTSGIGSASSCWCGTSPVVWRRSPILSGKIDKSRESGIVPESSPSVLVVAGEGGVVVGSVVVDAGPPVHAPRKTRAEAESSCVPRAEMRIGSTLLRPSRYICAGGVEANAPDDPLVRLLLPPSRKSSGGSWGPIPLVGMTELGYSFSCTDMVWSTDDCVSSNGGNCGKQRAGRLGSG